jgi:ankyrin repeat protein
MRWGKTMSTVFISYRRDDTAGSAGRVYDRLVDRLGRELVYRDVDSGQPGEDFVETIGRKVRECDVLLALIGPDWLRAVDESGGWRLAKADDLVRLEIATALDRGIRVIPVLLDGAKMPRAGDLPSSLAKLAHRNAVDIRDTHFDQDVAQLLDDLASHSVLRRLVRPFVRHGKWGVAALLLIGAIGGVYLSQVAVTPEQARVRLTQMNIPYTADAFVKAAELRDAKAIDLFLRSGMNPNSKNGRGIVALQWAAAHGDLPMMKSILKAGADFDSALAWAAGNGQMEALQLLLDRGPSKAALDRALIAADDELEAARLLLQRGADPTASGERGTTALIEAARSGQIEVVKLLLEHGANVNAARSDGTRRTALYVAADGMGTDESAIEVTKLLLDKGADINVRVVDYNSTEGWTPLLAAMQKKRWKLARYLVERGADIGTQSVAEGEYDEAMGFGLTPLMHAAREKHLEMGRFLLEKGARVDTRTVTGRTALSFAAEGGLAPFVEALLAGGASANDTDKNGWTPLMYASTVGGAEALLRKGANVNARTTRGSTALFVHAENGNATEVVSFLLRHGADPNAANDKGWTPLMAAASNGNSKNVQALLEGGASPSARNHAGETALDLARIKKNDTVVDVLLASNKSAKPQPRR